jgi:hypothetical protein
MTTQLKGPLKRELTIGKTPYILTIAPDGFKPGAEGKTQRHEMSWTSLVNAEAALATALQAPLELHTAVKPPARRAARK